VGTFVKGTDPATVEVLARSSIDFVVLDAEHAPFGRRELDVCVLAAREGQLPALVRVPSGESVWIQQALDVGASGVVVPHVRSAAEAAAVARNAHFGPGGRGFAGSTRAAGYTTRDIETHLSQSADSVLVVAQIEDADAAEHAEMIAGVVGVDAIFIGPVDLTISLGRTATSDPLAAAAMARIAEGVRKAGKPLGTFVTSAKDLATYDARGLTFVLAKSDQSFVLGGANAVAAELRAARGAT
jgi:2-keto-3-deoxy-L-rhamnonate aldolase RhmA